LLRPWLSLITFTPNLPEPYPGIAPAFYPASQGASEAVAITVDPALESVADFKLRERPRYNIQVRLTGIGSTSDAGLVFVPAGGDFCSAVDYAVTANAGTFLIRDVPEGAYVMAAVSGRNVISDLYPLKVDRNLPGEIPIARTNPVDVRGTVYFDSSVNSSDLGTVRVNLTRAGQEVSQVASTAIDASTRSFLVSGLGPGAYYATLDLPPRYFVKDVVPSRFDQTHPEDCVYPSSAARPSFHLDSHGHFDPQKSLRIPSIIPNAAPCVAILVDSMKPLYGYVLGVGDRPVAGALVVAIPSSVWKKEEDHGITPPDRYATAVSDDAGFFVLSAVPSIEYKLYAFENLDPNEMYDPDFAERFRNREIFTYRFFENSGNGWRVTKITNAATAVDPSSWCSENSAVARARCYLTVIPADTAER
jgi:hypothetical protein